MDPYAPTPKARPNVRQVFETLLELDAGAREKYLDELGLDEDRLHQLRALLKGDQRSVPMLSIPPSEVAQHWRRGTLNLDELLNQQVGPFRLTALLGHGGSASVFRAERRMGEATQVVALKLLRQGMFSADAERRFLREQAILAQLTHPNIARLIEAGVSETGTPYIAMELVEGTPITHYANTESSTLRGRVALMIALCRTIDAAHASLVVHRDIKPSNVLVDQQGSIKVLDFGIAKLLDEEPFRTQTQVIMLTPEYAAPEQFRPGPVTVAMDIYALGVLLGELLTGQLLASDNTRRASAAVKTIEPKSLPMGMSPPEMLARQLRGDLDAIIANAMAEEPVMRYRSAIAMADDLQRYLDGRPVQAHPPSRWYRTRKFIKRHRGGVLVTVVLLIGMLSSLGLALWQAKVARVEAREAQRQAERATETQRFLETLFQPLNDGIAQNRAPTLSELLGRARQQINDRYPHDPEVKADLLAMFVRINDTMGDTTSNRQLANDAARANELAYGIADIRAISARDLYARVLRNLGDYSAARTELEISRKALLELGVVGQDHARLLDALSRLGQETGMPPAEVIALQHEALSLRTADPKATPDDIGSGYNNLGGAYSYARDHASAATWQAKALEVFRVAHGDSLDTASVLLNLGFSLMEAGHLPEASQQFAQARAMFTRIPIERHPALVSLLQTWCGVLVDLESLETANTVCAEAQNMTIELHGVKHSLYMSVLTRKAKLALARGEVDLARRSFVAAIKTVHSLPANNDQIFLLGVIDSAQLRLLWLTQDYVQLRSSTLALLTSSHPRLGEAMSTAPYVASLAVLACQRAPDASCGSDRLAIASRLLAQDNFQGNATRLPALIALTEATVNPNPALAGELIAKIGQALKQFDRTFGANHSVRMQAHRALAKLYEGLGDLQQHDQHTLQAESIMANLPSGHPLRVGLAARAAPLQPRLVPSSR